MIIKRIQQSIELKTKILSDEILIERIRKASELIIQAYRSDNKTLFCGNGGSAADAQHLAAELSGKFYLDRAPIHADVCHGNSSFMTAVSNDYGYEMVFARHIQTVGKRGDVLVCISTSGNSTNIINAMHEARKLGLTCVALTGETGGLMAGLAEVLINVPSVDTPRIQEAHILIGHIICELVETELFGEHVG
ncbi:phosphoheptose isomerase 1 [Aquipluma nitroreducens]|uniref:Phosphoheptose isomerase n=1 Tax=Aquipluma nitroreducens TaxID=2010828 RepID=A0A5K7SCD1_9BACT|nr:SIS domain-containing protein [Aquipluma nitroreducens]BBE19261.1 phosphoheptose isomerase 1 [Aquipluma nitroreducens]